MLDFLKRNKTYIITSFIYTDGRGNCVKNRLTSKIKWLEKIKVVAKTYEKAEKEAFKVLESKYPQYKGGIWIL